MALRHQCQESFKRLGTVNTTINRVFFKRKILREWQKLCVSKEFFQLSHRLFFESLPHFKSNFSDTVHQSKEFVNNGVLRRTYKTKFSINAIGFDFSTLSVVSDALSLYQGINDEGVISENFTIEIYPWFRCSHFHFADQRAQLSDAEELYWLSRYQRLAVDPS